MSAARRDDASARSGAARTPTATTPRSPRRDSTALAAAARNRLHRDPAPLRGRASRSNTATTTEHGRRRSSCLRQRYGRRHPGPRWKCSAASSAAERRLDRAGRAARPCGTTPTSGGATGTVDMMMIGLGGRRLRRGCSREPPASASITPSASPRRGVACGARSRGRRSAAP